MEERLRERFEAGLVCDVRSPDPATRLTILRKRVQQDRIAEPEPAALELIADRVTDNVRALEGALIRIVAFGSLTGRPVTAALAEEVLAGLYPDLKARRRDMTVREIQERTAEAFGLSVETLVSASRAGAVAWPRQVAMYLVARADGRDAARHRPRVRRPQPHHRPARLPAHGRAHRRRRRRLRDRAAPHRAPPRHVTPTRLTDSIARVHTRRTARRPHRAAFPAVTHTITTLVTVTSSSDRPSSTVKQATR